MFLGSKKVPVQVALAPDVPVAPGNVTLQDAYTARGSWQFDMTPKVHSFPRVNIIRLLSLVPGQN